MMRLPFAAVYVCAVLGVVAPGCSPGSGDDTKDAGPNDAGDTGGDGNCPVAAEGNTVCDVQDANSAHAIATDGTVLLVGVVATSSQFVLDRDNVTDLPKIYGVFVSDNPAAKRSGVLVTYFADMVGRPDAIAIGDTLRVDGVAKESASGAPNSETRVQATAVSVTTNVGDLAPLTVTAALLDESAGEDYEGVLVKLQDVTVASLGNFGQFTLDNGIIVDDVVFHYPAVAGEVMASIIGVVQYNVFTGGGFRILPRQLSDVVSTDRPTNTVTELNDGTITRCAFNQAFNCPAAISDAVVVSPVVFVNDTDDAFDLFVFWIADANNKDANDRLGAFSGVRVSVRVNPASPGDRSGNYTWAQTGTTFDPGAAPEIGDVIELAGVNTEDFAEGEYEATFINKITTVADDPSKLVLPALFAGVDAAGLKGGRPSFSGDWPGLEDIAPAADIEQWEGALVELQDVATVNDCFEQPTPFVSPTRTGDFGNFTVTGDAEFGNDFFLQPGMAGTFDQAVAAEARTCATARACDSRSAGQTFDSLVGIVRFKFGRHLISPRLMTDIQPQSVLVVCP